MQQLEHDQEPKQSNTAQRLRNPIIVAIARAVPGLQEALGPATEVVLHDLQNLHDGIVAISGNVTARKIGAPPTDLLLRLVHNRNTDAPLLNYRTVTSDGRLLRSSTLFLHGSDGQAIACLCVNCDISSALALRDLIDKEIGLRPMHSHGDTRLDNLPVQAIEETFEDSVEGALHKVIHAAIGSLSSDALDRQDRIKLVTSLDNKGMFLIKNSVGFVANALCVSRSTIYNYLHEARNGN